MSHDESYRRDCSSRDCSRRCYSATAVRNIGRSGARDKWHVESSGAAVYRLENIALLYSPRRFKRVGPGRTRTDFSQTKEFCSNYNNGSVPRVVIMVFACILLALSANKALAASVACWKRIAR